MKSQGKTIFLGQEKVSEIGFMSGKCEILTKVKDMSDFLKLNLTFKDFLFYSFTINFLKAFG